MADLNGDFNADGHEPVDFGVLPGGDYELVVVGSEVKDTKQGDGNYAVFDIVVVGEGQGNGRHIWQNITLNNPSEKAVEIGKRQLADLCRAVGKGSIRDTSELHDTPFWGKVGIEKGKGDYKDKNNIQKFYPAGQSGASASAPAKTNAAPPVQKAATAAPSRTPVGAGAGAATPPWKRK